VGLVVGTGVSCFGAGGGSDTSTVTFFFQDGVVALGSAGLGAAGTGDSDILPRLGSFFVSVGFFQLGVDFHEGVVSGAGAAAATGGFSSSFGAATGFFHDGVELEDVFHEGVAGSSLDDGEDVVDVLFVLEL
jgi:hypothetical protein